METLILYIVIPGRINSFQLGKYRENQLCIRYDFGVAATVIMPETLKKRRQRRILQPAAFLLRKF